MQVQFFQYHKNHYHRNRTTVQKFQDWEFFWQDFRKKKSNQIRIKRGPLYPSFPGCYCKVSSVFLRAARHQHQSGWSHLMVTLIIACEMATMHGRMFTPRQAIFQAQEHGKLKRHWSGPGVRACNEMYRIRSSAGGCRHWRGQGADTRTRTLWRKAHNQRYGHRYLPLNSKNNDRPSKILSNLANFKLRGRLTHQRKQYDFHWTSYFSRI